MHDRQVLGRENVPRNGPEREEEVEAAELAASQLGLSLSRGLQVDERLVNRIAPACCDLPLDQPLPSALGAGKLEETAAKDEAGYERKYEELKQENLLAAEKRCSKAESDLRSLFRPPSSVETGVLSVAQKDGVLTLTGRL